MKFKLEINMKGLMFEAEPVVTLADLVMGVAERLEAHALSDGTGEGIIWDNDNDEIGRFGITE